MKHLVYVLMFVLMIAGNTPGANYYCDPSAGSMSNPGTSGSPWGTFEDVCKANKTFAEGDVIYLRNGYHGYPVVKGKNPGYVTIKNAEGHTPGVRGVTFEDATRWILSGLSVSPSLIGQYVQLDPWTQGYILIQNSANFITVKNCHIYAAKSIAGWTLEQMKARVSCAVMIFGTDCTITGNTLTNINYGFKIMKTAVRTGVTHNFINGFMGDGVWMWAHDCNVEYNRIQVAYGIDQNHDDGIQGLGCNNGTIRGNIIISQLEANQPFKQTYGMQGIGFFDGPYENCLFENNLIVCDKKSGLAVYCGINCVVVNNTVTKNTHNGWPEIPFITMRNHKNGSPASGNILRNNITPEMSTLAGTVASNNLVSKSYTSIYQNYAGFDFHLKAGSPAINKGTSSNAPKIDLEGFMRTSPYDQGAYEYGVGAAAGEVNKPVVHPGSGTYTSVQQVNITCATPGAAIYYTLDSSTPTESSPKYTGPITLDTTTILRARAFKSGATASRTTTVMLTIELPREPPVELEAESMTLSGYIIDTDKMAGRGIMVDPALGATGTGTATAAFTGSSGTYDITINAVPENDGTPTVRLYIAGKKVWEAVLPMDAKYYNALNDRLDYSVTGITINKGDEIKIEGVTQAAAYARVDKVYFYPKSITSGLTDHFIPAAPRIVAGTQVVVKGSIAADLPLRNGLWYTMAGRQIRADAAGSGMYLVKQKGAGVMRRVIVIE